MDSIWGVIIKVVEENEEEHFHDLEGRMAVGEKILTKLR